MLMATKQMMMSYLVVSFSIFIAFVVSSSSLNTTTPKCSAQQTLSLLLFKQNLSSTKNMFSQDLLFDFTICKDRLGSGYSPNPIVMNWNMSTDCCEWDGVTCNPFTGDVIGVDLSCGMLKGIVYLNTTLFLLPYLQRLNLAYNDFSGSQIPREIAKFSNTLTHLNLSYAGFEGEIPSEIFFLSKLVSLDLSRSPLDLFRTSFGFQNQPNLLSNLFENFTLLEVLSLRYVGLDGYLPTHLNTSSLKSLHLVYNYHLKGRLPDNLFNLRYLEQLDFTGNLIAGPFPKVNMSISLPLKWLGLEGVNISGEMIPDSIGHFKSLNYLRLSDCGLVGFIPKSIVNLNHLTTLDLSYNYMLNGTFPSFLFTLRSMEYIDLSYNQFQQALTPSSFIQLINLNTLSLSYNNITGLLELDTLLSTLTKLETLDFSYSGLSVVTTKTTDYANPDFITLALASCKLTEFPESIRSMKKLEYLDLSANEIWGSIPDWAGEMGGNEMRYVDLSHNSITSLPLFKWFKLENLYLQSNQIQGPFPRSICNMSNLRSLDMSNNSFGGVIPKCFRSSTDSLDMINLRTNHFNGTIPDVFNDCGQLTTLILNENQLEGEVPSSLSKCQGLKIIDLGNNELNGTFPGWLGDLPSLEVLVLKSNKLHGTIGTSSSTDLPFQSLQVLDLSHNGFVGHLPQKYFQNFIAMKNVVKKGTTPEYLRFTSARGYYSIILVVKGRELQFQKLLVSYTVIDLSRNRFDGEIPNVVGNLNSLIVLNLSYNHLNGRIPHALGRLSSIESLDLSWNQLTGEIPQSLADLNFLGYLNLSQNDLMGRIPQGKQFNTFERSSFEGNPKLCGIMLPKKCTGSPHEPQAEGNGDDDKEKSGFTWQVVMLGYGCGTFLGLVIGFLMVSIGRPKWFNEIYYAMEHMILKHMILKRRNKRRYTFIGK